MKLTLFGTFPGNQFEARLCAFCSNFTYLSIHNDARSRPGTVFFVMKCLLRLICLPKAGGGNCQNFKLLLVGKASFAGLFNSFMPRSWVINCLSSFVCAFHSVRTMQDSLLIQSQSRGRQFSTTANELHRKLYWGEKKSFTCPRTKQATKRVHPRVFFLAPTYKCMPAAWANDMEATGCYNSMLCCNWKCLFSFFSGIVPLTLFSNRNCKT